MSEAWFGLIGVLIGSAISLLSTFGIEVWRDRRMSHRRREEFERETLIELQAAAQRLYDLYVDMPYREGTAASLWAASADFNKTGLWIEALSTRLPNQELSVKALAFVAATDDVGMLIRDALKVWDEIRYSEGEREEELEQQFAEKVSSFEGEIPKMRDAIGHAIAELHAVISLLLRTHAK